jgi:hypothetical protein
MVVIAAMVFGYSNKTKFLGSPRRCRDLRRMIIGNGLPGGADRHHVASRPLWWIGKVSCSWCLWNFCVLTFAK